MNLSEADSAAHKFTVEHPEYWDDLKEDEMNIQKIDKKN